MNLETKITIYKFTPQVFTLTPKMSSNNYSVKKVHRLQTLIHIRKLPVLPKYRNLSKIRNSKRQHADTYTFHVPKHIGTRSNGSSGS